MKWLVWGGIFAAGFYVGVQVTKQAVAQRLQDKVNGLADVTGLSNTTYGKQTITALNQFIGGQFN